MKWLLIILLLTGCYTEKTARKEFAKAVISYPEIPAEYCSNTFPVKDSVIRDTVRTTDTLISEGQIITDTLIDLDTVRITIIKTLPGKIITNTVRFTDTIYKVNTAEIRACEINRDNAIKLANEQSNQAKNFKGKAQKRGIIMWSLVGLIVLVTAFNIYMKIKKV